MAQRPMPPHLQAAEQQVQAVLAQVLARPVDLRKDAWADLEPGVARALGGAFDPRQPEHAGMAMGLAAAFGERLAETDSGFWFPNRDAPEGAMVGFPEAVLMLSPLSAVMESLGRAKLAMLDEIAADIRKSLAGARFSVQGGAQRLDAEAYRQLFDPGMLQFLVVDENKMKQGFDAKPDALARDLRDAFSKAGSKIPADVAKQLEGQLVGGLGRLDPNLPLIAQLARGPRLVELAATLQSANAWTGVAPDEFWEGLAFPLLFIGAPEKFPPLDDEEKAAIKQGLDAFTLFLDVVPYQSKALDDGFLGVFGPRDVGVPHEAFARVQAPRLLTLERAPLDALLAKFDAAKSRDVLARWTTYLAENGAPAVDAKGPSAQMRDLSIALLEDLQRALGSQGRLVVRRMTEAEAQAEMALIALRQQMQAPRIILA